MSFTDDDFVEILNYCKDLSNFHENAEVSYDNIVNVSDSLIEDSRFRLFNFDNICKNIYTKSNGRRSNLPASADGLYFIIGNENNALYFFEFKNVPLHAADYKKELKSIKESLNNNHCYYQQDFCPITSHTLNSLDNIKSHYEDERICKLKLKTTESLFFILPKLFQHYKNNRPDFNKTHEEFIDWLLKLNKRFILVFANDNPNIPNNHFSFENKLKDNYKHFEKVAHIETSIIKKKDFEEKFLNKLEFIPDI
ncbi:hypothetical protein [uncultured Methanobrevibacter sp.]|uniref:hypothetical protein n=1 Tax=uncultured Methanobrevibacter sp. TaxID=253161 RepID=UPI002622C282|nr:hypothetical protein [uncultured Methanobrevibacter sp.]